MAQVILSMDVHCDDCAKKIRKAVMKVPGAESVTASFETGLVVVEGSADAAVLRERLRALMKRDVDIVSTEDNGEAAAADDESAAAEDDGETAADDESAVAEDDGETAADNESAAAEDDGETAATDGSVAAEDDGETAATDVSAAAEDDGEAVAVVDGSATSPATPIILEMNLHNQDYADKIVRRIREMPGVDAVITDVPTRLVMVTGTVDASALATHLQVRTRRRVRVVSDPQRPDAPEPQGGVYDGQHWAAPAELFGQHWPAVGTPALEGSYPHGGHAVGTPAPEGYYPHGGQQWPVVGTPVLEGSYPHGGQQWPAVGTPALEGSYPYGGQQWPAYQPPAQESEPEGHYSYDEQQWPAYSSSAEEPASEGHNPHNGQHDQDPSNCSIH